MEAAVDMVCAAARRAAPLFGCVYSGSTRPVVAQVRAGVDDDSPFEDTSLLEDHLQARACRYELPCAGLCASERPARTLQALGALGRCDAGASLGALHGALQSWSVRLSSVAASGAGGDEEFGAANEALLWLVTIAGHVLADDPAGDTPSVPRSVNAVSVEVQCARARGGERRFGWGRAAAPRGACAGWACGAPARRRRRRRRRHRGGRERRCADAH